MTTSISSAGNVPVALEPLLRDFPTVVDAELAHRGYIRHTVTPEAWTAEYRIVDDVTTPDSPVSTWRTFRVDAAALGICRPPIVSDRMDRMTLARDAGPTDVPLLDETIGANLARTVAAHGQREALVARHQGVRWTYDDFAERVERCARGPARAGPRGR